MGLMDTLLVQEYFLKVLITTPEPILFFVLASEYSMIGQLYNSRITLQPP